MALIAWAVPSAQSPAFASPLSSPEGGEWRRSFGRAHLFPSSPRSAALRVCVSCGGRARAVFRVVVRVRGDACDEAGDGGSPRRCPRRVPCGELRHQLPPASLRAHPRPRRPPGRVLPGAAARSPARPASRRPSCLERARRARGRGRKRSLRGGCGRSAVATVGLPRLVRGPGLPRARPAGKRPASRPGPVVGVAALCSPGVRLPAPERTLRLTRRRFSLCRWLCRP